MGDMIPILLLITITSTASHKVVDSVEDTPPPVTPLASPTPLAPREPHAPLGPHAPSNGTAENKPATSWKIETTYTESKLDSNGTESREQSEIQQNPSNSSNEFKPSPHHNSYYENSLEVIPTRESFGGFGFPFSSDIKKPPAGFHSPSSQLKQHKIPKDIFKNYQQFPYKIEDAILMKVKDEWKPMELETRPKGELPAGGLYKHIDAFKDIKEKPGLTADDDFGLEFSTGGKEISLKKRVNPWQNLVHLLTALIPVGLIVSALTPNVITIEPGGGSGATRPGNTFRRADVIGGGASAASFPPISDRCRRRLLCELQAEKNYSQRSTRPRRCRAPCEDPTALAHALRYLLDYHRTGNNT